MSDELKHDEPTPAGDELPPVLEPAEFAGDTGDETTGDDASDGAADAAPAFDEPTLDLLDRLCSHFGVVHQGDVQATAQALGELTGHSQLGAVELIHALAELSGHR